MNLPLLAKYLHTKRGKCTITEMSKDLGDVSVSTLRRIETEQINDMSMSTFLLICDALETHPAEFLRREQEKKTTELSEGKALELQVRQSKELSPRTANLMAAVIRTTYLEEKRWSDKHGRDDEP